MLHIYAMRDITINDTRKASFGDIPVIIDENLPPGTFAVIDEGRLWENRKFLYQRPTGSNPFGDPIDTLTYFSDIALHSYKKTLPPPHNSFEDLFL